MGLFSNGNDSKNEDVQMILNELIPRSEDGLYNKECKMFLDVRSPGDPND